MNKIHVTKHDGSKQELDHEKINEMVDKVCRGLDSISPSTIALNASIQFFDGIPTSTIQQTLIDSAVGLISDVRPDYTYAAARLFLDKIYKDVYGGKVTPPSLYDHIKYMVEAKLYDPELLVKFSKKEIQELDAAIDYDRDLLLSYAAVQQIHSKYLIQDRTTKHRFETPQQMFMVMAMAFHANEPENKVALTKAFYDGVSNLELSMPTPIQAGVRSSMKQYASCALIRSDDSLKSINAAANAATLYGAKRAGLGLDIGGIRAVGSKVGTAGTSHTGIVPFAKKFLAALKSCVTPDTYVEVLVDDTDTREGKIISDKN